jgi:hypothetical protein
MGCIVLSENPGPGLHVAVGLRHVRVQAVRHRPVEEVVKPKYVEKLSYCM